MGYSILGNMILMLVFVSRHFKKKEINDTKCTFKKELNKFKF